MLSHIDCTDKASWNKSQNASSVIYLKQITCHTLCMEMVGQCYALGYVAAIQTGNGNLYYKQGSLVVVENVL